MKKLLSILLAVIIIVAFSFVVQADTQYFGSQQTIDQMRRTVVTYNFATGQKTTTALPATRAATPSSMPEVNGVGEWPGEDQFGEAPVPFKIFDQQWIQGPDTSNQRWKRIAHIQITWSSSEVVYGTAFMIRPGKMLTAGHAVYRLDANGNPQYPQSIYVRCGRNGTTQVAAATCYVSNMHTNQYFENNPDSREDDYAVLDVPTSVSKLTGYFGYSEEADTNTTYTLYGYPINHGGIPYYSRGKFLSVQTETARHKLPTTEGHSGSPLYDSSGTVVAIHTAATENYNVATRITSYVMALVNAS